MEGLPLIDVASEDDLLLVSPPAGARDPGPAGFTDAAKGFQLETIDAEAGEIQDLNGAMDQVPELSVSPKQKKAKSSFNLRKSLAWDSAFFTSEGVLNTEELAIVNSTFKKAEACKLPEIAEETRISGESNSTLDSESWVLENLETELFDNVRASIQRSLGKSDKSQSVADSLKTPRGTSTSFLGPRQKVDRASLSKVKLPRSTSHGAIGKQRPAASSKESLSARVASFGTAEAKASSRPPRNLPKAAIPRVASKTAVTPANVDKRSSTGGTINRCPAGKTTNNSASVASQSQKSGSSTTNLGTIMFAATATSRSISMSTKSDSTKSPKLSNNKKRTAQRISVRSSSGSAINKDNPARTSRSRIPTGGRGGRTSSADPALKCPSISPSSSVDSMISVISEASSSASTVGKLSHTTESFDAHSSSSPSFGKSNGRPPIMNSRPCAATGNHSQIVTNTNTQGQVFKPSGLRMPTPKIGYFDAEKSLDQNINALAQPTKPQYSRPATQKPHLSSTQVPKSASPAFGQQESKLAATPSIENDACQSKVLSSYKPIEMGVVQTNENIKEVLSPCQVIVQEAHINQSSPATATDTAKENIPTLHQNIQPVDDPSALTVELMSQKLSSISLLETTDPVS